MASRQDPILKLILAGPLRYSCTEDKAKEASADCWEDINEASDIDQLNDDSMLFSKSSKKKSLFNKKSEKRKRTLERRGLPVRNPKKESSRKAEMTVSVDYEESIKKSKCSDTNNVFIDLFPPSGIELRDETLKELFTVPITEHQAMDTVSISIVLAKARLKQIGRKKSMNPKQKFSSLLPSSAFTTATAFRRAVASERRSHLDSFDQEYINLWTRPLQDTEIDEFQITFPKPHKKVAKAKHEMEIQKSEDEKPKKKLVKVITVDYTEILSDVNRVKEDNEGAKWTKVHEKVMNWAKKNVFR